MAQGNHLVDRSMPIRSTDGKLLWEVLGELRWIDDAPYDTWRVAFLRKGDGSIVTKFSGPPDAVEMIAERWRAYPGRELTVEVRPISEEYQGDR